MATKIENAQLSLFVYNVRTEANRPLLLDGWTVVEYQPDNLLGFSYGIFRNSDTGEVVVSYTGTNESKAVDFLIANIPAGLGLGGPQVEAAARVAAQAIRTYGPENVSFTGHSLGGGLASIMAAWFDRPATVFDQAPFELTARNLFTVVSTQFKLGLSGLLNSSFREFDPLFDFTARESKVSNYFVQDEALFFCAC